MLIFYGIAFQLYKISTRPVTVDTFNWLRRIYFWPAVVGGALVTGSFVTVANLSTHFWGEVLEGTYLTEKFLMQMSRASELRLLLVFLDISQHNALVIFPAKGITISEIN